MDNAWVNHHDPNNQPRERKKLQVFKQADRIHVDPSKHKIRHLNLGHV